MQEQFMLRALELAKLGLGKVSPNPMVGCVIVHNETIISEGYHQKFGQAHAEINAINALENKSLLPDAELFVSLEPCSHFGKTPPCADRLIECGIKKVWIACQDPNPKVSGRGISKLKQAGIEVEIGILEKQAIALNKRFITNQTQNRPFVLLKWAQTADGFIARTDYSSKWISGKWARKLVHKWRSEEDAVLVGTATALHDSPELNVRSWAGRNPIRVFLDRQGRLNLAPSQSTTYVLGKSNSSFRTIEITDFSVKNILRELWNLGIGSVMVEGGSQLLQSFLDANLWDRACVFSSIIRFGKGIPAPQLGQFEPTELHRIEGDELAVFENWHSFGNCGS
jgi:diaminohydroxyphosphoribosylaminopyrimidine deaminase/5-amino-6-(5-phosphoribosylamino)uracil reductase